MKLDRSVNLAGVAFGASADARPSIDRVPRGCPNVPQPRPGNDDAPAATGPELG
jgi:hypothetical protein